MTFEPMTLKRFKTLVTAYGGQLARWPEAERGAAEALLEVSEPARAWLAEEAILDATLEAFPIPSLSPALEQRLTQIPLRSPKATRPRWPFKSLWAPAVGWAAAAAIGVILGAAMEDPVEASTDTAAELTRSGSEDALVSLALGSLEDLEGAP
ncbi:MAG TPA: hypothetical protein VER33_08140 [Polyangiaceae bacterium]|nr:hypothetical protein [Polyangiaceae bacterium]